MTIPEIADEFAVLGHPRSRATIAGYFADPKGTKAKARKQAAYRGVCEICGEPTTGTGPGKTSRFCSKHKGAARQIGADAIIEAMLRWHGTYGSLPSSYKWNRSAARAALPAPGKRDRAMLKSVARGDWPSAQAVTTTFAGGWAEARETAQLALAKTARRTKSGRSRA
jgi:hypothetical protein